jgi:hypothetical protein
MEDQLPEDETTHIVFQGKHYVLPGKMSGEEAAMRVRNLTNPDMSNLSATADGSSAPGFEDTSAESQGVLDRYADPNRASKIIPEALMFGTAPMGLEAMAGAAPTVGRALMNIGKAAIPSMVGAWGGGKVGREVGGTAGMLAGNKVKGADIGEIIGSLAGGGIGAFRGPGMIKTVAAMSPHSRVGLVARLLGGVEEQAAATPAIRAAASAPAAVDPIMALAEGMRKSGQFGSTEEALTVLRTLNPEQVAAVSEQLGVPAAASARTPPQDLAAALQNARRKEELRAALNRSQPQSPLQGPRIQIGAQRVGKGVGMTKEQVRQVAGPVLDEAQGEASPILPKQAFQNIIDTMKDMPISERESYVARATSGKTKWQVENIRRTLEHLGLLLPVGAAAAMTDSQE